MIKADTPNLWELRSTIGNIKTRAIIIIALTWLSKLVNVERNLSEVQIGEIANDVIEEYGYMKVEEVKYVLKQAVKTEKVFGRLDYNVVMGWFERYAGDRVGLCTDISDQEATEEQNRLPEPSEDAMSFDEYARSLRARSQAGDPAAASAREAIDALGAERPCTPEEARQKEIAFRQWKYKYLKHKI